MKLFSRIFIALLILQAGLNSCQLDYLDYLDQLKKGVPTQQLSGDVDLSAVTGQLNIITALGQQSVANKGSLDIKGLKSDNYQALFARDNNGKMLAIGLFDPVQKRMVVNDTSTIVSMSLFHPYMIFADYDQRKGYIEEIKKNAHFSELLGKYNDNLQNNPDKMFEVADNSEFFQKMSTMMKETFEVMGQKNQITGDRPGVQKAPWVEDAAGSKIKFMNDNNIFYGGGLYDKNGALQKSFPVETDVKPAAAKLGWPPVIEKSTKETQFDLGDGQFDLILSKGFDFSKMSDPNDPVGKGTAMNIGQSVINVLEIIMGYQVKPSLDDFAGKVQVPSEIGFKITNGINQEKPGKMLDGIYDLIKHNQDGIAEWIFGTTKTDASADYIGEVAEIMQKVSFIFEVLGMDEGKGPFIGEMVSAPVMVKYAISQSGGTITGLNETKPPVAEFVVTPAAGIIGTNFTFDASLSTDPIYPANQLQYRWDLTASGQFTAWSTESRINYTYSEGGAYSVVLEVKNPANLSNQVTHRVNVGGGAGTANHVKVFKNNDPWNSRAIFTVLEDLGFREGQGANTYEVINSDQMADAVLIPGQDLVIIQNDQNQTFYDVYAANQAKFASFVNQGGSMFWEACDQGWAGGSIDGASIVLPGNVQVEYSLDNYNYVVDGSLPLVHGLPNQMDHNYASHEYFTNLVEGTTQYLKNSDGYPTLIEFVYGAGWVIMAAQPLEHQYDRVYNNPDMEQLLPRIVAYFTGKLNGGPIPLNKNTTNSDKATHLE